MSRRGENIYKRADGRYEGRYLIGKSPEGKRKYGYIYGKKYAVVKERLTAKKAQYANNKKNEENTCPILFRTWIYQWERSAHFVGLKLSTQQKYLQMLEKHILPYWEDKRMDELEDENIRAFMACLASKELSGSMIRDIMRLLRELLKDAVKMKVLMQMPDFSSDILMKRKSETKVLSKEEQKRLQECAEEKDLAALLSLYTGLRLGEICALKWKDIDWYYQTLTVERTVQRLTVEGGAAKTNLVVSTPKSQASFRTVPLPHFLIRALEKRRLTVNPEAYIMGNDVRPGDPRTIQARFQRLLKRACIPPMHFHSLRHTFTTRLLELGIDIKTVSSLLGHSTVKITMEIYAHSQMDTKRSAVHLLEENMY